MNGMTFGYLHDFRNPPQFHRPWAEHYGEILDLFTHIEGLGFAAGWVPEHHVAEDGYMPSPIVALTAIAARTKTLRLGSSVALAPFYHPVRFAEDCAVADIVSGGRFEMTLGLGYRQAEADSYGLNFKARASRTNEFLEIVRRLWAGERFSYEGKHFQLKDSWIMPPPVRGHIPLYVGGLGEKGLERVAKYGDAYFGNIDACDLYLQKLQEAGKDPASARMLVGNLFMAVSEDPERALEELAPYFYHVNTVYSEWNLEVEKSRQVDMADFPRPMTLEEFKTGGLLKVMTPDEAIAFIAGMRERAPIEHLMMLVPPGLPLKKFAPYAELFAKKVIPAFA